MKKQYFLTCLPWLMLNPFVREGLVTAALAKALDFQKKLESGAYINPN